MHFHITIAGMAFSLPAAWAAQVQLSSNPK
jgi:hypothetical protein